MEEREREWGARSPGAAGSPARPPSPRLDVKSDRFDPLLALYAPCLPPIPYPNAPCFNNVAAYETFLRTGCRGGRGRARSADPAPGAPAAGPSSRTRRRRDAPAPDPERVERLRRLMVVRKEGDAADGESRRAPGRSRRAPRNVLTRMPLHEGSPLGELHRCIREGVKVNVHIRTFKGLRGVCTGFLVAFDKFWNMALTDVDETYRKPVLGKAYERDSSLTLTRLFDRLKLQDSSKKEADSKSAVEDSTLSRYSQTSTWKVASVWGREDTDRGSRKHSRSVPSSLQASTRESRSELSGRTIRTEGSSAGGTFSRATTLSRGQSRKKKRKPKVDYQQVFTRHINQIFIRGENVLLVHLAQ
ncbi:U7 snRNA-associated Sm-like protein LSm11 isoform X1 [Pipistrellus kuhlii]|uniref:U7 snRNA-associated Sm-like protein LSm11 n=2 Tax=Pipistrellus kuhlii TaxID=59472 RepID=A0A7J7XB57_PIPKU|nr:U7 snRNA-associated Sm-like protein LSm11 isoform X1 [Pipistrellus kuhlii]KAF6346959.1 LSM11, U7 small nuclear RNA associated [Pipistrellus kuhlii]